jgi:hypothetical protein
MNEEAPNENEVEPAVAEEAPDWLSELEPPAAVIATEPQAEEAAPDWLSELEPPAAAAGEPASALSEADFAWMLDDDEVSGDEEFEPAEEEAEFSETPDWLAALEPSGVSSEVSGSAADENEAVAAEADDWMSELQTPASEVAAPSAADADFEWQAADAVSDELEAESEPEAEAATPASGEPDWLGAMNLTPQEAEPELAEAEITWTSDELSRLPPNRQPPLTSIGSMSLSQPRSRTRTSSRQTKSSLPRNSRGWTRLSSPKRRKPKRKPKFPKRWSRSWRLLKRKPSPKCRSRSWPFPRKPP